MKKRFRIQMTAVLLVAAMLLGMMTPATAHAEEDYDFTPRRVMVKRDTEIDGQDGMPAFFGNYEPAEETELTEGLTVMNAGTYDLFGLYYDRSVIAIEEDAILSAAGEFYEDNAELMELTGAEQLWEEGNLGQGVKVAIFDTAVREQGNLQLSGSVSFLPEELRSAQKESGISHGTAVASVLFGLVPLAELYSVEVLDAEGNGYYSSLIQGIYWAVENDMDVLVMSLGGKTYSAFLQEALRMAQWHDIVVLAAAGNEDGAGVLYPAAYPETLSVGAADASGNPLISYAGDVDCYAIGGNILVSSDGHRMRFSGSSAANAVAAAAAVQLKTEGKNLSREQVMALLINTSDDTINVRKAIEYRTSPIYTRLTNRELSAEVLGMLEESLDGEMEALADEYKVTVMYAYRINETDYEYESEVYWYDAGEVYPGQSWDDTCVYKGENYTLTYVETYLGITTTDNRTTNSCVMNQNGMVMVTYTREYDPTPTPEPKQYTIEVICNYYYDFTLINKTVETYTYYEGSVYEGQTFEGWRYYNGGMYQLEYITGRGCITTSGSSTDSCIVTEDGTVIAKYDFYSEAVNVTPQPTATPQPTNTPTPKPTATNTPKPTATNTPAPAPGYTFTKLDKEMYAKSNVNVRDVPYKGGTILGTLSMWDKIRVTGKCVETGWYRVVYKGRTGYVSGSYLIDNGPTSKPTNTPKPTATNTPKPTATPKPAITPTNTPKPTVTPKPVVTPTQKPAETPEPTQYYDVAIIYKLYKDGKVYKTIESITSYAEGTYFSGFTGNKSYSYGGYTFAYTYSTGAGNITPNGLIVPGCTITKDSSVTLNYVYYAPTNTPTPSPTPTPKTYTVTVRYELYYGNTLVHRESKETEYKENTPCYGYVMPESIDYYDTEYMFQSIPVWPSGVSVNENRVGSFYVNQDCLIIVSYVLKPVAIKEKQNESMGGDPGQNYQTGGGDPINMITGNFYLDVTDFYFAGIGESALSITRNYNSVSRYSGLLGTGWSFGYESNLSVDDEGNVTVVYADGRTLVYKKDGDGYLTSAACSDILSRNADGTWKLLTSDKMTWNYRADGRLTFIADRNGNRISFSYDNNGNLTAITGADGIRLTVVCREGRLRSITDPFGRSVDYTYDSEDRLVKVEGETCGTTLYAYDEYGMTSITDGNGAVYITNEYDERGRVVVQTDEDGREIRMVYDDLGQENTYIVTASNSITRYQYDENLYVTRINYNDGSYENYTYDDAGNRTSIRARSGFVTKYTYDENRNVTSVTNPLGEVTTFAYNEDNLLTGTFLPNGGELRLTYDANGNMISMATKLSEDEWSELTYVYDAQGRVLSVTDALGAETSFVYEDFASPVQAVNALGGVTTYSYDEIGRRVSAETELGKTVYEYNEKDQIERITSPDGGVTAFIYDAIGNVEKIVMPEQYEQMAEDGLSMEEAKGYRYTYDSMDRVIAMSSAEEAVTQYTYDFEGNVTGQSAPKYQGVTLEDEEYYCYTYDGTGNLVKVTAPDGGVTEYGYDAAGNVISVTYPNGGTVRYTYDALGRMLTATDTSGQTQYRYTYDVAGNVTEVKDVSGYVTYYAYNLAGQLTEARIPKKEENGTVYYQAVRYTYDRNGQATTLATSADYVKLYEEPKKWDKVTYAYDAAGNVTEVTDDNGAKVVYTYDVYSRLISQSVETGEEPITTSFTYDAMGNLTEVDGYEYEYDKNGNVVHVKTPEGAKVSYTYDADNRLTKTEETVWEDTLTVYKNAARLNAVSGTEGEKLYPGNELICEVVLETENGADEFEIIVLYDKERLELANYTAKQSGIRVSDDGNGTLVIITTWGLAGGKRTLVDLTFATKEMAEGCAYVAVSPESTVTKGKNTHAVSECSGVLAELHLPDYNEDSITDLRDFAILAGMYGKACGDEGWQASYDITGDGQVTEKDLDFIRDMIFAGLLGAGDIPEEQVSDHAYLPRYEITRQQKVRTTTYTYNAAGDVAEITDCNGNKVTYAYDSCGRVVSIIDTAGAKSTLEYDQMGNPVKVILPEGVTETYTYDSEGRVLKVTDALGATVTYTYDVYGRVKAVTDAVGVCTEYEYDIAGNVTKNLLTGEEYVYNVYGEIVAYTDAEGNTTTYTYDGQGNVTNVTDALGSVTRYTYRKDGLLATIEDASGAVTSYAYNVRGLVESETDPLGAVTSYLYDKEDRVVRVTEPNGTVTEYEYNTDGNVTSITATKEDGQASVLRYLYAMDGSLIASISDTDILTYQYDAMGQLTELNKNGIHTLGFGYDSNGNLLWLKESTNSNLNNPDTVTAYTYDLAGRLTEVRTGGSSKYELVENYHDGSKNFRERFTGGTLLAEYTYNADGTLNTMTDGAGSTTEYSYTNYKQVAEMRKVSVDGSLLYSEVNTYDGNGSLLSRITEGSVVVGNSAEAEYAYDALDRLIREVAGDVATTYTYDVMGNRLTKNADGIVTEYTYDLCNKLLSEVTENPEGELVTTYGYDLIGNLVEKVTPEGIVTYAYDALNQLTNVTNSDGTWQSSTYDASGIRSMLSENGITTEYVSFNGLVLAGYDKTTEQTEHYYYGTGLLATDRKTPGDTGTDNSKNFYYYVANSHGDVIGLTDNNGTLTETYTYDAFGTLTYIQSLNEDGILAEADTALSRFLYAGEQYDEVAGLYYLRARRYDTTVGRFTQEDTYIGDGRNLYVYVQNNPLKYVDPSGYCSKNSSSGWLEMQNAAFSGADTIGGMAGQNIGALISGQIEQALNQLPPEEEQRIRDGVWNVTKGVGVIASGGAALYALPLAAPAIAVTSTEILAGTTFAFGAADITEGTQDIIFGSTGHMELPSHNPIKDIVFGGNQQNYDAFEFALAGSTFGLGAYSSGAFYTPMVSGNVGSYTSWNSWFNSDGTINYPPNNGAVPGTEQVVTLQPGDILGRYGEIGLNSNYVTQAGADPNTLALPPTTDPAVYQEFTVLKEIYNAIQAEISAWGGSIGGGIQFELPMPIRKLIEDGFIIPK